jgi:hypothetical protein
MYKIREEGLLGQEGESRVALEARLGKVERDPK